MAVTEEGIVIWESWKQSENAFTSIDSTDDGIVTWVSSLQLENKPLWIDVTGIAICLIKHSLKALIPIELIEDGNLICPSALYE